MSLTEAAPPRIRPALPPPVPSPRPKRGVLLKGIGWEGYTKLLDLIGERHIRVTYDRGDAEIMSPLPEHEGIKELLAEVVRILADEIDLPETSFGSMTIRRIMLDRGLEPDSCFFLTNAHRLRGRLVYDPEIDPPPDLAIEVDITSSSLDRLQVYGALGVPEIWRWKDSEIVALIRQHDGSYRESSTSELFPYVKLAELVEWIVAPRLDDDRMWRRRMRAWVREVVVPAHAAWKAEQDRENPGV